MTLSKAIKQLVFVSVFFIQILNAYSQNGSEWIVPNQSYFKVKTFQDGIYAIPYTQLQSSGINTSDLTNLQMWFRGKEQAVYLNNDSLFFYGKKNDGTLDSLLYAANFQAHTYFNLLSDTCAYFFTIGAQAGKRISIGTSPITSNTDDWYYEESLTVFTEQYLRGKVYSTETHKSDYDMGEGWFGYRMGLNGVRRVDVPITNAFISASANIQLEAQAVGMYDNSIHQIVLLVGADPNAPDYTFAFPTFSNLEFKTVTASIPSSYLNSKSTLSCFIKVTGTTADFIAPAYVKVKYPRTYITSASQNKILNIADNGNQDRSIVLNNSSRPKMLLDISDLYNQTLIDYSYSNPNCTFTIASVVNKILIYNQAYKTISSIQSVNLSLPSLTENYYIVYPDVFELSAENYKQYRASAPGGSYAADKYSFEKLCNIYCYGEFSPVSIKRFCTELVNASASEKYLLILGKGVTASMGNYFSGIGSVYYRFNPGQFWNNTDYKNHLTNLVPTFGEPGSDLMYSIDANFVAQIYTGRVPARTNDEVNAYLDKVRIHESLDSTTIWRKHLIHLSGGKTASEISLYKRYVDTYKAYAESPHFGGKVVNTYVKNLQNGSVDNQLITNVALDVNAGISLMTFFGHSSAEINDVDIGFVSNPIYGYKNTGKYPMLLVNGCTSANIYTNYSFAEDWVNTPNLGAINVLGHTDIGYANNLNQYSTYFYEFQFNDERYRNRSIGFVMRKVIDSIVSVNASIDVVSQAQCTQMNLSGDPAMRLYSPSKPDYAVYGDNQTAERKCALASLNGLNVTAKDPFKIIIPVDNYGSTPNKTVDIIISRYVNNVFVKNYQISLSPIYYRDTASIEIINSDGNYAGENKFIISIDPLDSLQEIQKTNNVAYLNYYMPLSSVKCIYPLNYSVVSSQPVTLVAQPTNLLINATEYYFEIDTSKFFNSPFKQTAVVTSGSLPSWVPQLVSNVSPSDSIVYFWRTRFKTIQALEDTIWDNSSFIYIKNSNPGWSQTNVDQILENNLIGLKYIHATKTWLYPTTSAELRVQASGGVGFGGDRDNTLLSINNLPILQNSAYYNCAGAGGFVLFILNRSSLTPIIYTPNNYGWSYCGQNFDTKLVLEILYPSNTNTPPSINYIYGRDADGFINAVQHTNKNDILVVFNAGSSSKETWPANLQTYFRDSLHAGQIANLTDHRQAFLLVTKRSALTPLSEKVNTSIDAGTVVTIDTTLNSYYDRGTITTNLIGPSSKWGKMYFAIDTFANDIATLKLIRYNISGVAMDTITLPKKDSLEMNGTYLIDGVHTYCKLYLDIEDNATLTPSVLKKWQIIYNGVPEGSLNPYAVGLDKYNPQTRAEGDTIRYTYRFDNISDIDFSQPIKVVYSIRNESGYLRLDTVTYTALTAKQNMSFEYKFSTKGLVGKNYIQVYVNPQFQAEQYYSNNIIETSFVVEADKTQPVLEVAFDGIRIFDGDLVSASPLINISLRDNNRYLLMSDPNSIELFLQYPGQSTPIQITSTSSMVKSWSLENARTNTFVAEIQPTGLVDGTYTIIVQGIDASGNKSANNQYRITFKVENKPSISYFYPYPNPFSTNCRFVFTLSGTSVPDKMKIQIMTVSGKIVKEIFKEELGPLHIGNNITEYAWDGTDEFGDRLANGVYLYRVIIKDESQFFEHRENAGDKAFKHDWGKLYILR
ncbi:C25 family cysteine peptidase [Cytophaga aurantiaca]|uniref:putative type IX secretion system sortase PorU2 n=1 Tax=Cytophaga aurantiaca TaxID=29530 RepID=UPI0003617F78|nr:C25 family cysteine peptidase [Cytophaga aurantiaca]